MELKHLRYFTLVAELEHMTKAAEKLMVSQPFLTKNIKQLEEELGVELFNHVGRKIQLNEFGRAFYVHAQNILYELGNAQDEITEMAKKIKNTILMMSNVNLYMPDLLVKFHELYPDLTLIHQTGTRSEIKAALQTGTVDYALCVPPLEEDTELGIKTENVLLEGVYVQFSCDHPLKNRKTICFAELDKQNYVTSPVGFGMRDAMDRLFIEKDIHPRVIIETTDISAVPNYVKSGQCFAFMPQSVIDRNADYNGERTTLSDVTAVDYVAASWNEKQYKTHAHILFMDFLREHFNSLAKSAE